MADKAISELIAASEVTATDLFVLEQAGTAKKLSGQTLTTFLLKLVEAHGGIKSIVKTGSSGLKDTYTITMADESTNSFTVTNGEKGDKGDNAYIWVKYASSLPSKDSDIYDTPDNYLGIYTGTSSTAPTSYSVYKWYQIKGAKGDTGAAASLRSQSVRYQVSASGTVIPDGAWLDSVPAVPPGQYLWTQSILQFNTGAAQTSYSVARFGLDGTGSVSTVAGKSPDADGNIALSAADVGARANTWMPTAADVGARPASWTPGASEVGAIAASSGAVTSTYLASSAVTAAKIASNAVSKSLTVTLAAASWSSKKQTVTASGVTTSNTVIVSPAPASFLAYGEAQVRCTAQAANSLTFTCEEVPTVALTVNVLYINK